MDIELKKYDKGRGLYISAYVICVIFFVASITAGSMGLKSVSGLTHIGINIEDVLFCSNYAETNAMLWDFEDKFDKTIRLMEHFKNEDYINSGKTLNQNLIRSRIESLYYEAKYNYGREGFEKIYGESYSDPVGQKHFESDYADEITRIKEDLIAEDLSAFERIKKDLDQAEGFLYYAANDANTITNLSGTNTGKNRNEDANATGVHENPLFDSHLFINMAGKGEYVICENGRFIKTNLSSEPLFLCTEDDGYLMDRFNCRQDSDLKVYFAFADSYLADKEKMFQEARKRVAGWISIVSAFALITVLSFVFLIVMAGRKDAEGKRTAYRIDKVFTEFQLLVISLCFLGGGFLFMGILANNMRYDVNLMPPVKAAALLQMAGGILTGSSAAALGLIFVLSCIRNIKSGRFIKNSLLFIVFSSIFSGIKSVYHSRGLMTKVIISAIGLCLLSATVFGAVLAIALVFIFAPKWIRKYENIKTGIDEVKNGNLLYEIPIEGDSELDELAKGINQISDASYKAIQNELKNQRLKTDLISNVSHDLKTPLTSIITYIDLLKKESLQNENATRYLDVVEQKSLRLKKLTDDLFDAAKASSGAISVKLETVDMLSLINQGLGEMAEKIESSGLSFVVNAKQEKYSVLADGQLLWRVLENLLSNVLKYSLQGSRVYIDLKETAGINGGSEQILLEIKNISKTELNISTDELMERFKRGDESRATEGSGLGLSIARDLVILQNGWFELKIDGDLFKVTVMLTKSLQQVRS